MAKRRKSIDDGGVNHSNGNDQTSLPENDNNDTLTTTTTTTMKSSPPNQFLEDATSKKRINSYCLRYAISVMEDQANKTRSDAEQALACQGQNEASRLLQRRAKHHTQEIISRVRKRLRDASIPSKYHKTEDPCVVNMSQVNLQRSMEVQSNRMALEKLHRQKDALEQELSEAEQERNVWSEKVVTKNTGATTNAILRSFLEDCETAESGKSSSQQSTKYNMSSANDMAYHSAPKGAMSDLLNKL